MVPAKRSVIHLDWLLSATCAAAISRSPLVQEGVRCQDVGTCDLPHVLFLVSGTSSQLYDKSTAPVVWSKISYKPLYGVCAKPCGTDSTATLADYPSHPEWRSLVCFLLGLSPGRYFESVSEFCSSFTCCVFSSPIYYVSCFLFPVPLPVHLPPNSFAILPDFDSLVHRFLQATQPQKPLDRQSTAA